MTTWLRTAAYAGITLALLLALVALGFMIASYGEPVPPPGEADTMLYGMSIMLSALTIGALSGIAYLVALNSD